MALTDSEKIKIITDLCWPAKTLVPESTHYSNWVDTRINDLTDVIEQCVRDLLKRQLDMDKKLEKAVCRAGVSSVDGVKFRDNEIDILRKERKKLLNEMAALLDIPNRCGGMCGSVCI